MANKQINVLFAHGRYLLINLAGKCSSEKAESELLFCCDGFLGCIILLKDGFASCFHVSFSISSLPF